MKQNIKVAEQLIKLAKSLVADIEVDPTQHKLQELNEWIKRLFRDQANQNLFKLIKDKQIIRYIEQNIEQKQVMSNFWGVELTKNPNDDIIFRKTFVIKLNDKIPADVKIKSNNLYTGITTNRKENVISFILTLKAKDWYPLFRSCKELTYDDKGKFDKESFDKLKKSLEKCFEELKI